MISLLTTTINPKYLVEAALSVRAQTYKDFEWIVVVDGGYDLDTLDKVKNLVPQVKIYLEEKVGRAKSLIKAHDLASYPYIGWLDDDDLLHPDCLLKCAGAIDNNVVYTSRRNISKDSSVIDCAIPETAFSYNNLLDYFCAFHFRLYPRALYEEVGGVDRSFKFSMDYELTLRMAKVSGFHFIREVLYFYRVHQAQVSNLHKLEQSTYHQRAYNLHKDFKIK